MAGILVELDTADLLWKVKFLQSASKNFLIGVSFPGFFNERMSFNIIAIDWSALATWDNYFTAAKNAVTVGKHAGQVIGIDLLINGLGQTPDQIHAIGHSLGAHLVGHFARAIKESKGQISRVTGKFFQASWL